LPPGRGASGVVRKSSLFDRISIASIGWLDPVLDGLKPGEVHFGRKMPRIATRVWLTGTSAENNDNKARPEKHSKKFAIRFLVVPEAAPKTIIAHS
jgi:hypothetical protein